MGKGEVEVKLAQSSQRKKMVLIIVLAFIFVLVGAGGYWYFRISDYKNILGGEVSFPKAGDDHEQEILDVRQAFSKDVVNILLMGFDRDEARDEIYVAYRADTIMLASLNLETGKADVVSIPRDTLVPIYKRGGGRDKINSAYTYGWKYGGGANDDEKHKLGMLYQVETISMALKGVPIHYYAAVDMDAVKGIVDAMGGVKFNVPNNIYNKSGKLMLAKGQQVLNGKQFLIFVRNRNYPMGDIQRVKNQQAIMLELFKQFKSAGNIVRIPKIYSSVANNVKTNLSLEQIMSLAHYATKTMDTEKIDTHVLSTSFANGRLSQSWTRSYSYLIINQEARAKLLYDIWGLEVEPDATDAIYPPLAKKPKPTEKPKEPVDPEPEEPVDPEPEEPVDPEPEEPVDPEPEEPVDPEPEPEPEPDPEPEPEPEPDPEPEPEPEPDPEPAP